MSERSVRNEGSGRLLIAVAVIGGIVLAAAVGGYLWYRSAGGLPPSPAPAQAPQTAAAARPDEPVQVTLFVPANGLLDAVPAGTRRQPDVQLEAREAVTAVLSGEQGNRAAVLKDLRLRELYLDAAGTAVVDLSPAGPNGVHASAWEELLAVYAVVNTLTQNFPEVRQVRLLVDGREAQTLAGHIDLARSFAKRTDLVRGQ